MVEVDQAGSNDKDEEDSDENSGSAFTFELKDSENYPFDLIRIDSKDDTVANLEQQISEKLQIPVQNLLILLRHEKVISYQVRIEWFN